MKKNYIAYLLIGGAVYYYIVNKKKKDQLKELEVKTLAPIPQKKKIVDVVKKVLPVIKKLPVIQKSTIQQFDPFNLNFKDALKNYKFVAPIIPPSGQTLRPVSQKFIYDSKGRKIKINGIISFPDMC